MKKPKLFLIFIVYTAAAFLVAALFVIFLFRIYPNRPYLIFILSPVFGLIFGILAFLPFKSMTEQKTGKSEKGKSNE